MIRILIKYKKFLLIIAYFVAIFKGLQENILRELQSGIRIGIIE